MAQERRPGINKKVIIIVGLVSAFCLIASTGAGLWLAGEVKGIVVAQFNKEQLIICRNVARSIEKELDRTRREMLFLRREISHEPFDPKTMTRSIQESFSRMRENGVWRVGLIDLKNCREYFYGSDTFPPTGESPAATAGDGLFGPEERECSELYDSLPVPVVPGESVRVSTPRVTPGRIDLLLAVSLKTASPWLLYCHLDVSRLSYSLLKTVQSGETGYAWLIDSEGAFLYHPKAELVGKNSFEARQEKDPSVSYRRINIIEENNMLKGQEGTGWYFSGWHREEVGKVKKLIAYTPVIVSDDPTQKWSVAVCAPFTEIDKAFRSGGWRLFFLQGLLVLVIACGAAAILFFEIRWSRILENKVNKRTEDLKKSEERYRSLVESAEDFIFTVDASGCFQSMNSFTAGFFGGRPDEFIGKSIEGLFSREVAVRELKLIRMVFRSGKSVRDEFYIGTGEHLVAISANFMPLKNESGQVISVLCIARDVTENKKLEKQLINTEKLASMGTLAAGVAHEINNPIGIVLGFCDLLLERAEPQSREYEHLKTIERQGVLCKQVVENLLSFARQEKGESTHSNLNGCLTEIIQVVQHTLEMNNIELHLVLDEDVGEVAADSRQLQQVFLNLINNAMGAMRDGGDLAVRTIRDRYNRKAIVEFQDTGVGIKEEHMDRIFEPFFTTKPEGEGTGLGLFVSYGIVSKYGGTITCTSSILDSPDKRRGTIFTVKLPLAVEEE